jgi:hypothetical protein
MKLSDYYKDRKRRTFAGFAFFNYFHERERESCGCALVIDAMARGDDRIVKLKSLDKYPLPMHSEIS